MIQLLALALIGPIAPLTGLDTISPVEIGRAAGGEAPVRAEIERISGCLRERPDASECLGQDACALPSPSACAHVSAEAWSAYMRHYLNLLTADATVGPKAKAAQKSWERSMQADCSVDAIVIEVRRLPYPGYYGELCLAGAAETRALLLRDHVINLYGDASMQGGEPYPGRIPFAEPKR